MSLTAQSRGDQTSPDTAELGRLWSVRVRARVRDRVGVRVRIRARVRVRVGSPVERRRNVSLESHLRGL